MPPALQLAKKKGVRVTTLAYPGLNAEPAAKVTADLKSALQRDRYPIWQYLAAEGIKTAEQTKAACLAAGDHEGYGRADHLRAWWQIAGEEAALEPVEVAA